jgi:hypothetical protein
MITILSMMTLVFSQSSGDCFIDNEELNQFDDFHVTSVLNDATIREGSVTLVFCKERDRKIAIDGLFFRTLVLRCLDGEIVYGSRVQRRTLRDKIQCIRFKIKFKLWD